MYSGHSSKPLNRSYLVEDLWFLFGSGFKFRTISFEVEQREIQLAILLGGRTYRNKGFG